MHQLLACNLLQSLPLHHWYCMSVLMQPTHRPQHLSCHPPAPQPLHISCQHHASRTPITGAAAAAVIVPVAAAVMVQMYFQSVLCSVDRVCWLALGGRVWPEPSALQAVWPTVAYFAVQLFRLKMWHCVACGAHYIEHHDRTQCTLLQANISHIQSEMLDCGAQRHPFSTDDDLLQVRIYTNKQHFAANQLPRGLGSSVSRKVQHS